MSDDNFSGEQSLELIRSMINRAKNNFSENGHLYLVWGWAVLFCSVAQFVLLHFIRYENHYLVWMLTWLVVIYQVVYLYRNRKKRKVKTYTGDMLSYVWIVFVILMCINGFILSVVDLENSHVLVNPMILSLYGMPTFLSGKILRFQPLILGGIVCWVLAIVSCFIPYDLQLLLFGIAVISAWIIPGYLLRNRHQTEIS